MRVETAYDGRAAVVRLDGRLDAECATQLVVALEDVLRSGGRTAVVDLTAVGYASSAGAAAITRSARDFAAVRGELFVAAPPHAVRLALSAAGLDDRVLETAPQSDRGSRISVALDLRGQQGRDTREWHAALTPTVTAGRYEAVPRVSGATLACRAIGDPVRVGTSVLGERDCHPVVFDERKFGLGLGAIGDSYEQCRGRFGELLATGGVVVHLPTAGGGVPDYLATLGGTAPQAMLGAGLVCEGEFSHLVRFSSAITASPVPLAELAEVCLDTVGADAAGVVMVAEAAGLVGAWRRASAGTPQGEASFDAPVLREWLSLTSEPAFEGTTVLVVGVVARRADAPLAAHLRPLRRAAGLHGHLHAAVFPYRPVPQRTVSVRSTVASLLEPQGVRAVLHLLVDRRLPPGTGESTFLRGLAGAAPIARSPEGVP